MTARGNVIAAASAVFHLGIQVKFGRSTEKRIVFRTIFLG